MLTINHLQRSDYYDEHNRVQGHWLGLGAAMLVLAGQVDHIALKPCDRANITRQACSSASGAAQTDL